MVVVTSFVVAFVLLLIRFVFSVYYLFTVVC